MRLMGFYTILTIGFIVLNLIVDISIEVANGSQKPPTKKGNGGLLVTIKDGYFIMIIVIQFMAIWYNPIRSTTTLTLPAEN